MSNLNSLPVAPEFVEVLSETATKTATDYLESIHAPEHVVDLVRLIGELGYYMAECYRNPSALASDRVDRFDIETATVETINAIVKSGGIFSGPWLDSQPRQVEKSVKVKK